MLLSCDWLHLRLPLRELATDGERFYPHPNGRKLYGPGGQVPARHRASKGESHLVMEGEFFREGLVPGELLTDLGWRADRDIARVVRIDWACEPDEAVARSLRYLPGPVRPPVELAPGDAVGERWNVCRVVASHLAARCPPTEGGVTSAEWCNAKGPTVLLGKPGRDVAQLRRREWYVRIYWQAGRPLRVEVEQKRQFSELTADAAIERSAEFARVLVDADGVELVRAPSAGHGGKARAPAERVLKQVEGLLRGLLLRRGVRQSRQFDDAWWELRHIVTPGELPPDREHDPTPALGWDLSSEPWAARVERVQRQLEVDDQAVGEGSEAYELRVALALQRQARLRGHSVQ